MPFVLSTKKINAVVLGLLNFLSPGGLNCLDFFYGFSPFMDGFAKGDGPSDRKRGRDFHHEDSSVIGHIKAPGDGAGHFPGPFDADHRLIL
jgi:hypothetical protein